ncbi:MAG: hypothetical protein IJ307_00935 [Bacteroidales bacterium]|nr:hypothetical protein [Bacteroidales bacterium]
MKYISLGAVLESSTEHIVKVSHCGIDYTLTQELASLWLDGRFRFAEAGNPIEMKALNQLYRMGLVMTADDSEAGEYRALTRCRMVPVKRKNPHLGLRGDEKTVMLWLREAGLVLTMAELTYLMDRKVRPELGLLGQENKQALVERIYTKDTIFDNVLENQMEHVPSREKTVKLVLGLLKKKHIVML